MTHVSCETGQFWRVFEAVLSHGRLASDLPDTVASGLRVSSAGPVNQAANPMEVLVMTPYEPAPLVVLLTSPSRRTLLLHNCSNRLSPPCLPCPLGPAHPSPAVCRLPLSGIRALLGFPSPVEDSSDDGTDISELLVRNPPATFFYRAEG